MRGYSQQQTASERPNAIEELKSKMKWIDIKQFLENRRYYSLKNTRTFLHTVFFFCLILSVIVLYYVMTPHTIYSGFGNEQQNHVSGLEYLLVRYDFIYCDRDSYIVGFANLCVWSIGMVSIVLSLFTSLFDSSCVKDIYNIQDGESRFRAVENNKGKKGICKAGKLKMKLVLPFEYDEILATYDNSYLCKKNGKYGVYNTDLKKMVLPEEYDDIHSITPESIVLIKGDNKQCFSNKGYRIVNK